MQVRSLLKVKLFKCLYNCIMKRSAIYIKVQSKYTCVGGSACIIYYSSIEIYIRSGLANKLSQIKASLKYY